MSSIRTAEQISAVQSAADRIGEVAVFGSPEYAYAAAITDVLAWLAGDVSANVFQGYDMVMAPITAAATGAEVRAGLNTTERKGTP